MSGQMAHPDTTVLAEFRAGLIIGARGGQITAHLAECEHCAGLDASLAAMPALLAAAAPPALPADLARRLDQVLAAEVGRRNQAERAADNVPPSPVPRRQTAPRKFRFPSWRTLAPVGAIAAVIVGGVFGLSQLGRSSTSSGADSSGVAAGGAARSAAASFQPNAKSAPQAAASPKTPAKQPISFVYVTSPADLAPATLTRQLEDELAKTPAAAGTVKVTPDSVRACVARVAPGASVIRVETARYDGRSATVIFTRNGQADRALVTSPDCSGTSGSVVATRNLPSGISGP